MNRKMTPTRQMHLTSGPEIAPSFRRQPSFLSPTGWFTILALGAVAAGTELALAT